MSDNSIVIVDGTGTAVLAALNAAFDTLNTLHAGATAPVELVVGMLWADTNASVLKRLASTGPAVWTTLGTLGTNMGMLPATGGSLTGDVTATGNLTMSGKVVDLDSAAPASASSLVITGGNLLQPSGTTTITGFAAAQAGAVRTVHFTTVLQLTHSASFYLPGAQNITTASGDIATFVCTTDSTTWKLATYQRADGGLVLGGPSFGKQGADITAAATTNLATATGDFVKVTNTAGTVAITALGTAQAGTVRIVNFSVTGGSLSITHNGTSLILPGANNISISDGDSAVFVSLGSGNWRCISVQKNSLAARVWSSVNKTAGFTLSASDYGAYFQMNLSADGTIALPSSALLGAGFIFAFRNNSNYVLTIQPTSGDTFVGFTNASPMTLGAGSGFSVVADGGTAFNRFESGIAAIAGGTYTNIVEITASGNWTIPGTVSEMRIRCWGAGGGGGGGGVPTATYGVAGAGAAGGASSFGAIISANGGAGGSGANQNTPGSAAGTGGTGVGGSTTITGGAGGAGVAGSGSYAGSAGGGGSSGGFTGFNYAGSAAVVTVGGGAGGLSSYQVAGGAGGAVVSVTSGAGGSAVADITGTTNANANGGAGESSSGGGGGAAGEVSSSWGAGGQGGGAGGYSIGTFTVTPNQSITVTIGAGGGGGGGGASVGSNAPTAGSGSTGGNGGGATAAAGGAINVGGAGGTSAAASHGHGGAGGGANAGGGGGGVVTYVGGAGGAAGSGAGSGAAGVSNSLGGVAGSSGGGGGSGGQGASGPTCAGGGGAGGGRPGGGGGGGAGGRSSSGGGGGGGGGGGSGRIIIEYTP